MTPERVPVVEYISKITTAYCRFMFRAPPLTYTSNIYYLPFSGAVWICCLLAITLCTFAIYLAYKWSEKVRKEYRESASHFLIVGFGIVCQVGAEFQVKGVSSRIGIVSSSNSSSL